MSATYLIVLRLRLQLQYVYFGVNIGNPRCFPHGTSYDGSTDNPIICRIQIRRTSLLLELGTLIELPAWRVFFPLIEDNSGTLPQRFRSIGFVSGLRQL